MGQNQSSPGKKYGTDTVKKELPNLSLHVPINVYSKPAHGGKRKISRKVKKRKV